MVELIKIFENPDFGSVRIITDDASDNIMFCAMDVCAALGYSNGRKAIADHVGEEDVTKRDTPTNGGIQLLTYVTESGLYSLIFGSKQDRAKKFKRWVTSEVLPSIRKTGNYSLHQPSMEDRMRAKLMFADWSAKFLNLNDASKLGIAQRIGKEVGLDEALPKAINAGTERPITHSTTDLLKKHGVTTSTQVFNKILEAKGIVITATRPGKGGKVHSWKVLVPAYDKYGQNQQDPKFQKQTQIQWYDNLFGELLALVGVAKEESFNM